MLNDKLDIAQLILKGYAKDNLQYDPSKDPHYDPKKQREDSQKLQPKTRQNSEAWSFELVFKPTLRLFINPR